jgi:hydrogenase maturation protease
VKPRALVVGVGRPRFGDDALGLEVAQKLQEPLAGVARVVLDSSTGWEALDALGGEDLLILIDAAESSPRLPPGASCRLDYPDSADAIADYKPRSTHTLSIDSMLQMAATLGRLPKDVWIYFVAGARFHPETDLSPAVAAAAEQLAQQIEADVRGNA